MLIAKENMGQLLPETFNVTTIADHLRATFAGVPAEPLPAAMEKLLRQNEPRIAPQEIEA